MKQLDATRVVQIVHTRHTAEIIVDWTSKRAKKRLIVGLRFRRPPPAANLHTLAHRGNTPPKIVGCIVIPDVVLPNGRHTPLRPPWAGRPGAGLRTIVSRHRKGGKIGSVRQEVHLRG